MIPERFHVGISYGCLLSPKYCTSYILGSLGTRMRGWHKVYTIQIPHTLNPTSSNQGPLLGQHPKPFFLEKTRGHPKTSKPTFRRTLQETQEGQLQGKLRDCILLTLKSVDVYKTGLGFAGLRVQGLGYKV